MNRRAFSFLLVVMSMSLPGCVRTNATLLGTGQGRAALSPERVAIYRTAAQVPGRYEEVALLHSKGPSTATNEPQMFESMREKAAEVGANGIILEAISEPSAGAKIAGAFLGYAAERQGKAIAIYVFPEPPVPPPTSATQSP